MWEKQHDFPEQFTLISECQYKTSIRYSLKIFYREKRGQELKSYALAEEADASRKWQYADCFEDYYYRF